MPHYKQCMLVWFLFIDHACWSIATATDILLVDCRWKKDGYKPGATLTEVPLHQTCLLIRCNSRICLLVQCNSIRHACWIIYQIRMFVKCCSIRQGIWSVTNPFNTPTGRVPAHRFLKLAGYHLRPHLEYIEF